MERVMSSEERIRRAEEIYERRKQGENKPIVKVVANNQKKDIKLLKKLILQILVCVTIYLSIYAIYNNKYLFSEDFIKKANEILSYDTNFTEIYNNVKNQVQNWANTLGILQGIGNGEDKGNEQNNAQENKSEEKQLQGQEKSDVNEGIGGAVTEEGQEDTNNNVEQLSRTEQDIQNTKNTTTFIKPVEGTISSKYGQRDTATGRVPKNHTGTDIAAVTGTKIKSATEGEVVLVSEEGDYGKHIKVQIGDVSIIYAHCNQIYVKQGDKVVQGQEIAEVGSTGNSTGPHLHFEVRIQERTVDPQQILEL